MVNPVLFSGMVQRTQDVSIMKQNEDARPQFEHAQVQARSQQEAVQRHEQVVKQDNADKQRKKFDAKEKGNGEYYESQKRKKNKEDEDGKVINKSQSTFDVQV
ncbi:MAG: hypothetical protein IJA27_05440 [Lachnospiraceae bacterium]|nr:hypothetical protein [Lachnospiraceae bacterium]